MASFSAKNSGSKRQKLANQELGSLVDRISDLPDSILIHILSFLPTKHAVKTGVLSKRWEFLWTNVLNLDFQDCGSIRNSSKEKRKQSFKNFVYRVLLQHTVGSIHTFSLQCGRHCVSYDVESWLLMGVARNVQEIYLGSDFSSRIDLPPCVFTCKTLVFLKLSGDIAIKVPQTSSVCFPTLKTFHLDCVRNLNDKSVRKLISSCLVLENLLVRRDEMDKLGTFCISAPALKCLKIYNLDGKDVITPEKVLEINAPRLEYLDIRDHSSECFLVTSIGSLVEANVDVGISAGLRCWNNVFRYPQVVFESFEALCNVKYLSLSGHTSLASGMEAQLLSTKFSNLTHLSLGSCCSIWHQLLPYFLGSSDHLEVLKFVKDSQSDVKLVCNSWVDPEHVPRCLLSSLRAISIDNFLGTEDELAMLKYILKNDRVLEALELHHTALMGTKEVDLETKLCILQKISEFPRGSETCAITFY